MLPEYLEKNFLVEKCAVTQPERAGLMSSVFPNHEIAVGSQVILPKLCAVEEGQKEPGKQVVT